MPGEQVNVALGHAPLPAYPGQVMLFAQRVILGKTDFSQVPAKLKNQVAAILIEECGLPELVPVEFGGTAE